MRKAININNCIEIGYIKKTHGIHGCLNLVLENGMDEVIEDLDFLLFRIDGLPVPFFIEEINTLGDNFANITFNNICNKEVAQQFVGCSVLVDKEEIQHIPESFSPLFLNGFTVIDQKNGIIGNISNIDDFGGNLVLTVIGSSREIMIPLNEELVLNINAEEKTILMDCPEGLLDIE